MEEDALVRDLGELQEKFLARVAEVRPDLHRYCARMMGSVIEGEDIVQDTLARAFFVLPQLHSAPSLRPWLFRIAHNLALDRLRSASFRRTRPLEEAPEPASEGTPEGALSAAEGTRLALQRFLELPVVQRSCVVLKDVLDHSLEETAEILELTVPAVKAALHRGRARLVELAQKVPAEEQPEGPSPDLVRYAALFNARDWDGVRALLAEDVRLDLVSRAQRKGAAEVGTYFERYDQLHDWHLAPAWLEGREVLAVSTPGEPQPRYFVELTFLQGRISLIRDYRHVPYIAREATISRGR